MATTPKLGLAQPVVRTRGWEDDINLNWSVIDSTCLIAQYYNRAGIYLEVGDVVVIDLTDDESIELTTTDNDDDVVGVVLSTIVVQDGQGLIVVTGPVDNVKVTGTIEVGDHLCASSTQGYARKAEWYENSFAVVMSEKDGEMVNAIVYQQDNTPKDQMICRYDEGLYDIHLYG